MLIRRWVLAMCMGGALLGAACGDDSDSTDGTAGGGAKAGTGNPTAGSGATLTADQAIAGACDNQEDLSKCMGLDEVTTCVLTTCALQTCLDSDCKAYDTCLRAAADPCNNTCTRTAACNTCIKDIPDCSIDKCIGMLKCP